MWKASRAALCALAAAAAANHRDSRSRPGCDRSLVTLCAKFMLAEDETRHATLLAASQPQPEAIIRRTRRFCGKIKWLALRCNQFRVDISASTSMAIESSL